jgi:hypothetical protein
LIGKYGLAPPSSQAHSQTDGKTYDLEEELEGFYRFLRFCSHSGQNKVLVLPSSLLTSANKKLLDFRDKTVWGFRKTKSRKWWLE